MDRNPNGLFSVLGQAVEPLMRLTALQLRWRALLSPRMLDIFVEHGPLPTDHQRVVAVNGV